MFFFDGLFFLVVVCQGIYDLLDIKIDFIIYVLVIDCDVVFLLGKLDGMFIDYLGVILLQVKGSCLCLVMEIDGSFSLIVSKKSNVRNLDDLKGKNIFVFGNIFVEYVIDEVMKWVCLYFGEVNKFEINNIFLRLMMLEDGQIFVFFLFGLVMVIVLNDGYIVLLNIR